MEKTLKEAILVIEDNPRIGEKLVAVLSEAGYGAYLAGDSAAGLALAQRGGFALVLSEYAVPGLTESSLGELKAAARAPLLLMSTTPLATDALKVAVAGFLLKPFGASTLLEAVAAALARQRVERSPMESESGLLKTGDFARLLTHLALEGHHAILRLSQEDVSRTVYFVEGLPVFAESSLLSETLGRFLLGRGLLSETEYRAIQQHQARFGVRQGEAMVSLGIFGEHELYRLLRAQVRERLLRCFDWVGARYTIEPSDGGVDSKLVFPHNPLALLVEAVVRRENSTKLRQWLDAHHQEQVIPSARLKALSGLVNRLQREPPVCPVLAAGPRVGEVPAALKLVETRAAATLLALEEIGALRVTPACERALAADHTEPGEPTEMTLSDPRASESAITDDPLAREVLKAYLETQGAEPWSVLGLSPSASPDEVDAAYTALRLRFHPDRFAHFPDPEVRARAKEVFVRVGQARARVSQAGGRARRSALLDTQLVAEAAFVQGESLLKLGDLGAAKEAFAQAHALHPPEPLYQAHLGYVTSLTALDEVGQQDGEALLMRGLMGEPSSPVIHRLLARLYERTGRGAQAQALLDRAIHLESQTREEARGKR